MIFGAIIGDVVGSRFEFNNIKTKEFKLVSEHSQFTDDSVMTLAIAKALRNWKKGSEIDEGEFEKAVIKSMRDFGARYPDAGYGGRFFGWLHSDTPKPYNSWGNGSAMRVSPVAWYFENLEDVEKFAAASARVTHNHPEGIKGAQATAAAIFMARTGKSKSEIKQYIEEKYNYNLSRTCDEIRPNYAFNESCQKTVPEAIIAFLEGENFEDALRLAISLGGDSDTLADITCAIAEGMWGVPKKIEKLVEHRLDDFIMSELEDWEEAISNEEKLEKVKNGITEMVFILDRSGSMEGLESDTIGGFNSTIENQKKEPGEAFVSTVLFDHEQIVLHDRVKLSEIPKMTEKDYRPRGTTALLDALGKSIRHISNVHKNLSHKDVPENTIFVIITDGLENSSEYYSSDKVKSMIERMKNKNGWEFLFLAANIDAVETASDFGISSDRAVNYMADSQGTGVVYASVNRAIREKRVSHKISMSWSEEVEADYNKRNVTPDNNNKRLRRKN